MGLKVSHLTLQSQSETHVDQVHDGEVEEQLVELGEDRRQ